MTQLGEKNRKYDLNEKNDCEEQIWKEASLYGLLDDMRSQ